MRRAMRHRRGRRDRALDHGAPFQHRAVAFPARAQGRGAQVGRRRRRRRASTSTSSRSRSSGRARRWSPSRTCRTCWAPSCRSTEIVRIAHARGIPVLVDGSQGAVHLPVDVQATRLRLLRASPATSSTARPASACSTASDDLLDGHAALQGGGEMIDDVDRGRRHLRRAAAPLRGRHAADRPGDRARRGARLHEAHRPRRASPRTSTSSRPMPHERLQRINSLRHLRRRAGQGRDPLVRARRAPMPTTCRRSSTATGVAVRAGTHCAQPLMARFGVTSTCRASLRHVQHAAPRSTLWSRRSRKRRSSSHDRRIGNRPARNRRAPSSRADRGQPRRAATPAQPSRRRNWSGSPPTSIAALKTVYDPEIPADIYELGLIYRVDIDDDRNSTST